MRRSVIARPRLFDGLAVGPPRSWRAAHAPGPAGLRIGALHLTDLLPAKMGLQTIGAAFAAVTVWAILEVTSVEQ